LGSSLVYLEVVRVCHTSAHTQTHLTSPGTTRTDVLEVTMCATHKRMDVAQHLDQHIVTVSWELMEGFPLNWPI
jgi:hypothetical protein